MAFSLRQTTPLCYKIQIRFAAVSQRASARFIYCPLEVNNIDSALAAGSKKTHSPSVRSQRALCPDPAKATTFHSAHVPYVQIVIIAPIAQQSAATKT
jgi:hypothetical protein